LLLQERKKTVPLFLVGKKKKRSTWRHSAVKGQLGTEKRGNGGNSCFPSKKGRKRRTGERRTRFSRKEEGPYLMDLTTEEGNQN